MRKQFIVFGLLLIAVPLLCGGLGNHLYNTWRVAAIDGKIISIFLGMNVGDIISTFQKMPTIELITFPLGLCFLGLGVLTK